MSKLSKEYNKANWNIFACYNFDCVFNPIYTKWSKGKEKCLISLFQDFNESYAINTFDCFLQFLMALICVKLFLSI